MTEPPTASPPGREWFIALNARADLGRATACRLAALGLAEVDSAATLREHGVPASVRALLRDLEKTSSRVAATEIERAAAQNCRLVTLADPDYPAALRQLDLPPPALYLRGSVSNAPTVAIVGARRASPYGLDVGAWLARALAGAGVTIVSGFAVGVDAAAHRGALAGGGPTVAVLGCGIDIDYPRGHRSLGREIARAGALLTEFPPGCRPNSWQFPVRNRIIAALAQACVVVEAAPRSGSLVTARLALELGRDVLAVPGRVTDELAMGTNALLADGARPALDPRDVLEVLGVEPAAEASDLETSREPPSSSVEASAVWRAARQGRATAEALAGRCELAIDRTLALLLDLELAGHLRRGVDGCYEVAR